jgi:hypothetical protein
VSAWLLLAGLTAGAAGLFRSRLFCLGALGAWAAAALAAVGLAAVGLALPPYRGTLYLLAAAGALSLAAPALFLLRRWQNARFAAIPFTASILIQSAGVVALLFNTANSASSPGGDTAARLAILAGASLLLAAGFFIYQLYQPFQLFPTLAVLSLLTAPYTAGYSLPIDLRLALQGAAAAARLSFFFLLFFQALAVLLYGVVIRSRSLVFTSILFTVLGVVTVVLYMLKGISTVLLLGCTGLLLLALGITAVLARERLIQVGGRLTETMHTWLP